MDTTAKHARDIADAIESARVSMEKAADSLNLAADSMEDDYPHAGNMKMVSNTAGALEALRFTLIHESLRWSGYADAREHNSF